MHWANILQRDLEIKVCNLAGAWRNTTLNHIAVAHAWDQTPSAAAPLRSDHIANSWEGSCNTNTAGHEASSCWLTCQRVRIRINMGVIIIEHVAKFSAGKIRCLLTIFCHSILASQRMIANSISVSGQGCHTVSHCQTGLCRLSPLHHSPHSPPSLSCWGRCNACTLLFTGKDTLE